MGTSTGIRRNLSRPPVSLEMTKHPFGGGLLPKSDDLWGEGTSARPVALPERNPPMIRSHLRKILLTMPVLGIAGALAGLGAYSAFTATTTNTGNSFASGTVAVSQHSGSTTLYSGSNKSPSDSTVACVRVTYTGTLPSAA